MAIITGFGYGIVVVNTQLSSGFIPLEDQGMIYGIIQTPPGSTLEYTNAKARELQEIARNTEGVTSVSSLAGYEVLTEGRGSNAGTCLINLKNWSDRKKTSKQIIEELEEKGAEDLQRQARVLRAARGPGLRRGRRFLRACPRQDEHERLPGTRPR